MFKPTYIHDLLKGQLSQEGYAHFLNCTSFYVRRYNWPKYIIVSNVSGNSKFWSQDDIKELTHQYFEWMFSKGKLEYLSKIPDNYLSYYFSQMLISFVANRIKQEQQKQGLSFEKCKELVLEISQSDLINKNVGGSDYVYNNPFNDNEIKSQNEIEQAFSYLSIIPVSESTVHFKPLVKMAIEDIFNNIKSPIIKKKLIEYVFALFDQRSLQLFGSNQESSAVSFKDSNIPKHKLAITDLLIGLPKEDAVLILEYLFQSLGETSLSDLASKYNIAKSTLHHKIESFKKKITTIYIPENEEDGLVFIQSIASALDKHSK